MARKLKLHDIYEAESGGYGYLGHTVRGLQAWVQSPDPYASLRQMEEAVVAAANAMGWTVDTFQRFLDSSSGRHMGDGMHNKGHYDEMYATAYKHMLAHVRIRKVG